MRNKKTGSAVVYCVAFVPFLLIGCATTYKADPKLVGGYTEPSVNADETNVYVIRGSNFLGAARGVWIAHNDHVVADLANGSHVLLKIKSGINTVNGVQGLAGFAFAGVDNRPGQTVYLSMEYAKGSMKEVPKDLGIAMVKQTKEIPPLPEQRPNTGYDDGLLNPGMLGLELMTDGGDKLTPDANSAVITFMRPGKLAKDAAFSIWSEAEYVGSIKGGTYFQIRVSPGKHTFIGKSEHFAVLKADVAAGKQYFVQFEVDMGWNQGHVKILPLDATTDAAKIDGWLKTMTLQSVNVAGLQSDRIKPRLAAGNQYLATARKKSQAGELPSRELTQAQGK